MKELLTIEIDAVAGGDSWAGTTEGWAPASPTSPVECATDLMKYGSGSFLINLDYCYAKTRLNFL